MQLERLERWTVAAGQAALFARYMGAQVDVPAWADVKARFDQLLAEEPRRESTEDREKDDIMKAVGLREL